MTDTPLVWMNDEELAARRIRLLARLAHLEDLMAETKATLKAIDVEFNMRNYEGGATE